MLRSSGRLSRHLTHADSHVKRAKSNACPKTPQPQYNLSQNKDSHSIQDDEELRAEQSVL